MDDLKQVLSVMGQPRPLPEALREKLAAVFAGIEAEPVALSGIDIPRPIPPRLGEKLMATMTAGRLRRALGASPMTTALGALSAAALIVIGAVIFAGEDATAPLPAQPNASPSSNIVAIATPDPISPSPAESPASQRTPRRSAGTKDAGGSTSASHPSGFSNDEACFAEENCPYAALSRESTPGSGTGSPDPSPTPTRLVRAPSPPRDVTASPGPGVGQIMIGWTAPDDPGSSPIRKYALYRTGPDGVQVTVAILDADAFSYIDSDLPFGSYSYRLRVRNYDAISSFSESASAISINSPS